MKIEPGKFIIVEPTKLGVEDVIRYSEAIGSKLECAWKDLSNPGLFLVVRFSDIDYVLSYIDGNKYALGMLPNRETESILLGGDDVYCEVKLVIDSDDEDGLLQALKLVNGVAK